MGISMHSRLNPSFWQQVASPDAGRFVQVLGNTLVTVTPSLFGQALNSVTWSSFNSTQQEWFGRRPYEVFS
jgi:hypothetical protein